MSHLRISLWLGLLIAPMVLAQNLNYQQDPSWRAPTEAAEKRNPLAERLELAAGGKKLFTRNCVECHGKSGAGLKKAADLQLPTVQGQSDGALFWKITNGNPDRGMPSFSRLPELQRWQIVLFLRQLKRTESERSGLSVK
jgi:mono/diheme cytochrome c family protein